MNPRSEPTPAARTDASPESSSPSVDWMRVAPAAVGGALLGLLVTWLFTLLIPSFSGRGAWLIALVMALLVGWATHQAVRRRG